MLVIEVIPTSHIIRLYGTSHIIKPLLRAGLFLIERRCLAASETLEQLSGRERDFRAEVKTWQS